MGIKYDVMALWQERAANATGQAITNAGHFLAEEAPEATLDALLAFMKQ